MSRITPRTQQTKGCPTKQPMFLHRKHQQQYVLKARPPTNNMCRWVVMPSFNRRTWILDTGFSREEDDALSYPPRFPAQKENNQHCTRRRAGRCSANLYRTLLCRVYYMFKQQLNPVSNWWSVPVLQKPRENHTTRSNIVYGVPQQVLHRSGRDISLSTCIWNYVQR